MLKIFLVGVNGMERPQSINRSPERKKLAEMIANIYDDMIKKSERMADYLPLKKYPYSRDNFLSFLVLREMDLSKVQMALQEEGLAALETGEAHVIKSIEKILNNLGVYPPPPAALQCPDYTRAKEIMKTRAEAVFGTIQPPGIMVTLDSSLIHEPEIMEQLLLHGMDIARINCAHDSPPIWEKLIDEVRTAERKLTSIGKYGNRTCKIYMDLAGPKIRIGKIQNETLPLKLSVPRDAYGNAAGFIQGYISTRAENTMNDENGSDSATFILAVSAEDSFDQLKVGDELTFNDIRGRKRGMKVIDKRDSSCIKVQLDKTAYIDETTILQNEKITMSVRSLLSKPETIEVKKGDKLRLYLDENRLGHAGDEHTIPGVPVTLPKAFKNVRIGDRVFIDDGKVYGIVSHVTNQWIDLNIAAPSLKAKRIKEGNGFNLPDSLPSLNAASPTKKDLSDLSFIVKYADIVGLSFVHSPKDLSDLRDALERLAAPHLAVVAKIETKDAIHNLARIILEGLNFEGFGVMIARGDLAVEVGFENLAYAQEEILSICRAAHVPVIWATQVLDRLLKKGVPSRAEITDAIMANRAQCVMLNKGPYIIEALKVLSKLLHFDSNEDGKRTKIVKEFTAQYGIFHSLF
ncbi:pyruvate kinase [Bacillus songklensis]|uniref:Pyruvate kinase n=1 Tax=Bacillus songklensis TaxID=1069116 RepID=A0ABV8B616_9BACI